MVRKPIGLLQYVVCGVFGHICHQESTKAKCEKGKRRMKIIFFHPNQDVCEFISNAVKREKTMQAVCGKLEDLAQQGKVTGRDVVVTSGNSFGLMDGGVDLAVAQTWPGIEGRIQTRIAQLYGPEMPIGTALRAKVANSPNVIYVPTMQIPMEIVGTDYVYQAARAAVLTVKNELSMTADVAVFMPLMGTGTGGMTIDSALYQMLYGIRDGLREWKQGDMTWMHAYDMHTRWHNMCGIPEDHPADESQQEGGAVPDE